VRNDIGVVVPANEVAGAVGPAGWVALLSAL
jgi:hypothetical protein